MCPALSDCFGVHLFVNMYPFHNRRGGNRGGFLSVAGFILTV